MCIIIHQTHKKKIISANAFDARLQTTITLNVKSGSIFGTKMSPKVAGLEVRDELYYLHGKTLGMVRIDYQNVQKQNPNSGKVKCKLLKLYDVEFEPKTLVQHLPLNVQFEEVDEEETSEPIDHKVNRKINVCQKNK